MTCTSSAGEVSLTLSGSSTEANSVINGFLVANANKSQDLGDTDVSATTSFGIADNVNVDLEAPSGAHAILEGADGVNSLGADCWANWTGI
jgi:hypothetical protein